MDSLCVRCKGRGLCGKRCHILDSFKQNAPKISTHFSGPSPPEVFVGRIGYPHVNSGILAPTTFDTRLDLNNAEDWSKENLNIANVLRLRAKLIYGRSNSHIKKKTPIGTVTKELAMAHKPTATEFFLKKKPIVSFTSSSVFRPMTNPAPIRKVLLEENTKIKKKVDYLVNDSDVLATGALKELYTSNIQVDHLQKLLSVGLLGRRINRRMVPTRWSITAVDDTISKQMLERIRYHSEVDSVMLFSGNFVGNYVEILILPGRWSFEAIEAWDTGIYNQEHATAFSSDHEGFYNRKKYAFNVTGGYYAMRLPVCEWLDKTQKQGAVLVFRRIKKEYYAPLGVGIVREATRRAINNGPVEFESKEKALENMQERIGFSPSEIKEKSWILENYGKQKRLSDF